MEFRVEEVCIDGPIEEQRHAVLTIERNELVMESLGMSLSEGKAMLSGGQDVVIAQQAREYLEQQRTCPDCGRLHTSKDAGAMPREDRLRLCAGRQPTPEPLCVSGRWSTDVPPNATVDGSTD